MHLTARKCNATWPSPLRSQPDWGTSVLEVSLEFWIGATWCFLTRGISTPTRVASANTCTVSMVDRRQKDAGVMVGCKLSLCLNLIKTCDMHCGCKSSLLARCIYLHMQVVRGNPRGNFVGADWGKLMPLPDRTREACCSQPWLLDAASI